MTSNSGYRASSRQAGKIGRQSAFTLFRRDIVKCCGWGRAHPDGLSGGFNVSVLKFDALDDEFNEFVTV